MLSTSAVFSFSIRVELISAAHRGSIFFSTPNSNLSATPMHKPRHLFCVRGKNPCSQSYLWKYSSCKGKNKEFWVSGASFRTQFRLFMQVLHACCVLVKRKVFVSCLLSMEADLSFKNQYKYNDLGCVLLAAKLLVNVLHLNVWQGNLHRRVQAVQAKSEKHPTNCSQAEACLRNWFWSIPHHRPCWCPWTNSLQTAKNAATTDFALENRLRILVGCYCLPPNASQCYPACVTS